MKTSRLFIAIALFAASAGFGASARAGEARLEIDRAQSRIEYVVTTTFDTFTGKVAVYDLGVFADPAAARVTRAELRFRFSDMSSGNEKRDADMRAWQGTDQFPEVVFTLISLTPAEAGKFTARGQLIFHGLTRELAFPVSITASTDNLYMIDGETSIDCRDYGLPVIRKFLVAKVAPVVKIRWHLQGKPAR